MADVMRAITLTQPWAGLVMSGIKLVENRPRPIIKNKEIVDANASGVPIRAAIHASREIDESVYSRVYELAPELGLPGSVRALDCNMHMGEWYRLSRITSAILGTIDITGALYIGGCDQPAIMRALGRVDMLSQLRFTFGPTVYTLARPSVLKSAVPCKGKLGFWKVGQDLVDQMALAA
ncbi:MAG TPA: hypothetical protein VI259_10880 [Gemmatimonadaceae bacterium]